MTTKIHIVERIDNKNWLIIEDSKIKKNSTPQLNDGHYLEKVWHDYDDYELEKVYVVIKQTFLVITTGQFIRNDKDNSKLNASTTYGGMREISRLAYAYSVVIMDKHNP